MTQLQADAAYYRQCAQECARLKAAIERDGRETNRTEVLDALDRDIRLWTMLADEIEDLAPKIAGRAAEADLFGEAQ